MFFECNISKTLPAHIHTSHRATWDSTVSAIYERMEKLERALNLTGMPGEQFAIAAKKLFDQETVSGVRLLDTMTDKEIASVVTATGKNIPYQKRYDWSNCDVVVDTAFVTTDEWEMIRMIGIGGSDAAVVLEISPYRIPRELYHDKVGTPMKFEQDDPDKDFIFAYGHKVESLVVETFCKKTGATVIPETRMFSKKGAPYITANIDAILIMPDGRIFVFEAKTTSNFNKDAWAGEKIPRQYVPQTRQYMMVLDDPRICGTYIACIYGNNLNCFKAQSVERDSAEEEALYVAEEMFWNDNVLSGVEPDDSGIPDREIELMRRLNGPANKKLPPVELEASEFGELIEEYQNLDEERKALDNKADGIKERQKQLSQQLISALGQSTKGELEVSDDEFYEISYAPRSKTTTDVDALRDAFPEAYNQCVTVVSEGSRVFGIKKKTRRIKTK